jgi:hypothetical protein
MSSPSEILQTLIEIARQAHFALDDGVDEGDEVIRIPKDTALRIGELLGTLDELPDPPPGDTVLNAADKAAYWFLNVVEVVSGPVGILPASAVDTPSPYTSEVFIGRLAEERLVDMERVKGIVEGFNTKFANQDFSEESLYNSTYTGNTGLSINYKEAIESAVGIPNQATVIYLLHLFKKAGWQLEVRFTPNRTNDWRVANRMTVEEVIWRIWLTDTTVSPNNFNFN